MTNRLVKRIAHATGARTASASRRATRAPKPSPAVNGHLVDLASHFNLRSSPGYYSENGRVALLRRAKAGPHDELLLDFSQSEIAAQLRLADRDLLRGPWTFQATADGRPLTPAGPWEEVCWHTDADGDYLEIEQTLAGGWLLQRQMYLAREDRFLFLADALIGSGKSPAELHYRTTLPLAAEISLQPVPETREARIVCGHKPCATVLPLALPEWRAEFCHASLNAENGHLQLEQKAAGRNLYAPLFLDLNPARQKHPLTWRRLTVAENLRTVSRDEAVGYRVQIGRQQWLIYRTLDPRGNRSVLSVNTVADFVLRRFLPSGKTISLVVVE